MATLIGFALYNTTCGANKTPDDPTNNYKTSECIGKNLTAVALMAGIVALLVLSICGALNVGPMAQFGYTTNVAICGTLGAIEGLTILGLVLKALGCGEGKAAEQNQKQDK